MTLQNKPQSRKANIALICVFMAFTAVFLLLLCILPKHEGELSPNERRVLADAPNADLENILNGNFATEVDSWLEDHFPARNFFVALYSYLNHYTGRNATESIIMGKGDRLFTAPVKLDEKKLEKNGHTINSFAEENSLETYSVIIPSAGYMLEDELPALHLDYNDAAIISGFNAAAGGNSIDVENLFASADDLSSLYYRTDHHLSMDGSYLVYCEIAEQLGISPISSEEFNKASYDFYGTSYGSSGLLLTQPDTLEVWTNEVMSQISVTTIDGGSENTYKGMIDEACLKEDVVDKYAAYLYSNHGVTIIENSQSNGRTLLVLKDSYGNAIVPFLAEHFSKIVMIDTRYYNSASPMPSQLCEEYGIDEMLIILGVDTAQTTNDLVWLR